MSLSEIHEWFRSRGWWWSVGCGSVGGIEARCWRAKKKPWGTLSRREDREVHIVPGATPEAAIAALMERVLSGKPGVD